MIRIVLADDHAMVRESLRKLLSDFRDMEVVGVAASADDLFASLALHAPQVAVLDVSMPGPGIAEVLTRVGVEFPAVRTLVLSMFSEELYAKRALAAGASAYLSKDQSPELLVEAIRKVARGGRYVSPSLADLLVAELGGGGDPALHHALSDRELSVLRWIAGGKSVKEIAASLGISPKTVSTYRRRLLEKLSLATNADIVRYVDAHQLGDA